MAIEIFKKLYSSYGIQLERLMGGIGIKKIDRITDERIEEIKEMIDRKDIWIGEIIEKGGSLRVSFGGKMKERAHGNRILSTDKRHEECISQRDPSDNLHREIVELALRNGVSKTAMLFGTTRKTVYPKDPYGKTSL